MKAFHQSFSLPSIYQQANLLGATNSSSPLVPTIAKIATKTTTKAFIMQSVSKHVRSSTDNTKKIHSNLRRNSLTSFQTSRGFVPSISLCLRKIATHVVTEFCLKTFRRELAGSYRIHLISLAYRAHPTELATY
jgi:hypothetical protein